MSNSSDQRGTDAPEKRMRGKGNYEGSYGNYEPWAQMRSVSNKCCSLSEALLSQDPPVLPLSAFDDLEKKWEFMWKNVGFARSSGVRLAKQLPSACHCYLLGHARVSYDFFLSASSSA